MVPTVNVAIPTYNRSRMLAQTIASVLQQTFQDFEIIVSDDCSSDDTAQVVRAFGDRRIRYHRTPGRLRVPGNWNECIRLASAEFFTILPDDDAYCPEFLERMVGALRRAPDIGVAQCGYYRVDHEFRCIQALLADHAAVTLRGEDAVIWEMRDFLCNPAALLFRRLPMLDLGLWREDYWDDWAFIVRLCYRSGLTFVPESLACVRFHEENLAKQIVDAGFDNILNIFNQQADVFGAALPATPRLMALRASRDRHLSRMCIIAMLRQLQNFNYAKARLYFAQARHLYALAGIDPGFVRLAIANTLERRRDRKRRHAARLRPPVLDLNPKLQGVNGEGDTGARSAPHKDPNIAVAGIPAAISIPESHD
jgi:glycosyltransferase involved in cell wall biosynthesis